MIWLDSIAFVILSVSIYCLGGQVRTWIKRFVLPCFQAALLTIICLTAETHAFLGAFMLLYMGVWVIGEGTIAKWGVKNDRLVYALYGLLASIPLLLAIWWFRLPLWMLNAPGLIIVAFIPNFGSWGKIGKYDIMGIDIVRMLVVSVCWLVAGLLP